MIGDEVTVTVLGVKGNQVRLGINAPTDVAVHREEIYRKIKNELNDEADNAGANDVNGNREQKDPVRKTLSLTNNRAQQ